MAYKSLQNIHTTYHAYWATHTTTIKKRLKYTRNDASSKTALKQLQLVIFSRSFTIWSTF